MRQHARPAASLLGLLLLAHTGFFTWAYFSSTPFWDFWNWLSDYQSAAAGHTTFHDLIKPHNEHRILTARLLLFTDARWFHMTGHFVAVVNLGVLCATGLILNRQWHPLKACVPAAISMAIVASTCQWQNLLLPFDTQMALLSFFMVCTATTLEAATRSPAMPRKIPWTILAGLCFFLAAFSMAGGLLELPWLVILLWLRRSDAATATIFLLAAAAAAALFLHDYHPDSGHPLAWSLQLVPLLRLVTFAAGFLASAFYPLGKIAFLIGFLCIAAFAAATYLLLKIRLSGDREIPGGIAACHAVAGSFILIAAAAAVSRLSTGMSAALEPRYATHSVVFLSSLAPVLAWHLSNICPPQAWRHLAWPRLAAAGLPAAASAALLLNLSPRYPRDARAFSGTLVSQALSMRQNVFVPEQFRAIFYGTHADAAARLAFLHDNSLAVFAPGMAPQPPDEIENLARSKAAPDAICQGHIDLGYRLDGRRSVIRAWVASRQGGRPADWLILKDADGNAAKIIPATEYRADLPENLRRSARPQGFFTGLSLPPQPGAQSGWQVIGAFAGAPGLTCVLPDRFAPSPLEVHPFAPNIGQAPAALLSEPVLQGAYHPGGGPPGLRRDFPREAGNIYTSADEGDTAHGQITFALPQPAALDISLPFATEPGIHRQFVAITFGDGFRTELAIPENATENIWRQIVVPHDLMQDHRGASLSITAEDRGGGWGEWLAVGAPALTAPQPAWASFF